MIGSLWLDASKKSLEQKLSEAVAHYQAKHNRLPDFAQVSLAEFPDANTLPTVSGVKVSASRLVLRHHIFVGVKAARRKPQERQPNG